MLIRSFGLVCAAAFPFLGVSGTEPHVAFPDHPRFAVQRLEDQFGLGAVTVTAMGQDRQGFLWIGTQTGLYRFDGARARKMQEVESIVGHYVADLLIAPDGTVWVAGSHGIAHYRDGHFERLAIPLGAMPLASGNQNFAIDGTGVAYVLVFRRGILRIDPAKPEKAVLLGKPENAGDGTAGIARAADDTIWFTYGRKLAHVSPGSNEIAVDPSIRLPEDRVVALLFDGTQELWLRTATHLMRLDRWAHKAVPETAVTGTANEEEGKPSLDARGKLLVPSSTGLYWQQDGHWRVLTDKLGLSSNDVQSALEDNEGALWVAGSGTGLDRLPGIHEWSAWTTAEGLPDNSTWATLRDRTGRLWVSTARGIGIWDHIGHRWIVPATLSSGAVHGIRQIQLARDGAVWGLTSGGRLIRINPNNYSTSEYPGFHGRAFVTVTASPKGDIWATTRARLVRFDGASGPHEPHEVVLPAGETEGLESMGFSPGGVLWATGRGTLYRFDGSQWRRFTVKDGLQGQTLTSVVSPNDNEVWIAYNDVVKITHVKLDAHGVATMEHHDWDWTVIGCDSKGRIWFNGTEGIQILSPDGRLQRKNHSDGLVWDDVSPWTGMREEADGSYLIATSRGLGRYSVDTQVSQAMPNVVMTSIILGGTERSPREVPEVDSSEGSLEVQFTPMDLDNASRTSCRYLLHGLEKEVNETQLREARYGGLPPGNYEFWVQCRQGDLGIASAPARFKFRVLPSLWQTSWARLGMVGLVFAGFWGIVSLRTRALNRHKNELEQAVAQRSAELLQKNKELEDISLTDPLTSIRNRRYFYETIPTDSAQALRSHLKTFDPAVTPAPRQELIFVLVDIDRFKRVNDELGHAAGDHLLLEVAKRIASVMRRSDDLVRWGGEEFLLVCRTTDRENAAMLCTRVLEAVRELPFDVGNGVQVHKTCSIGWAPFPWMQDDVGALSIDNVIELADKALYLAKREGRNRSFGLLPSPNAQRSPKSVSIENLRDCPPDLVQIV